MLLALQWLEEYALAEATRYDQHSALLDLSVSGPFFGRALVSFAVSALLSSRRACNTMLALISLHDCVEVEAFELYGACSKRLCFRQQAAQVVRVHRH